ncbi:MAG: phospholipase D family protein [Candidatus Bathyarchaeia archaeon]
MRRSILNLIIFLFLVGLAANILYNNLSPTPPIRTDQNLSHEVLGVYFSPRGGCANQVIHWIERANNSIYIMIYSFTLDSIGNAILDAYRRGVEVRVVFEKSQISQYSEYYRLKAAGVMVRVDTNPHLMHHKVMIVDGVIVLTGSFNWSASAENENNENLIVIKSKAVAEAYRAEFMKIWNQSVTDT